MSLDKIRKKINRIDNKLMPLMKKRMDCSLEVAKIKAAEGLEIYHPKREEEILKKAEVIGGEYGEYVKSVYRTLMSSSRRLQGNKLTPSGNFDDTLKTAELSKANLENIICPGTFGSFSHIACTEMFPDKNIVLYNSFDEVFDVVSKSDDTIGVLPIENSTAGSVIDVFDLMKKYKVYFVGEHQLKIRHNLLTLPNTKLEDIKEIYSHPQALAQCNAFLKKINISTVPYVNTALAAEHIKEIGDESKAAIGSLKCAEKFGLEVLKSDIQNNNNNTTRFVAISKKLYIPNDADKVSIYFTIPHIEGSLYSVIGRFAASNLNLTKIESRPLGKNFEYGFYLDFNGNVFDERVKSLLSEFQHELPDFVFLGNYGKL